VALFVSLGAFVQAQTTSEQLKNDFTFQYDQYRVAYDEFLLKKNQYQESETIAAQEELTVAAKQMLLTRASTYIVHWQILENNLFEVMSFQPEAVAPLLQEVKTKQVEVANHKQIVSDLLSYQEMGYTATAFNGQSKPYDSLTYKSSAAVLAGRFRRSLDAETNLLSKLEAEIPLQIRDTTKAQSRLRGLVTVKDLLNEAESGYDTVSKKVTAFSDDGFNQSDRYNRLVDEVQPAYESLRSAHQLLVELSQGLE
jgi:hypothetical protein